MNNAQTTEREYLHLMMNLAYDSLYFEDVLAEFLYQLREGETKRMSAVMALNNFELIKG